MWQHVIPAERAHALPKLLGLLRPGGVLAVTLRQGPAEAGARHASGVADGTGTPCTRMRRDGDPHRRDTGSDGSAERHLDGHRVAPAGRWHRRPGPCSGTSFSTTRKARPTSLDCCPLPRRRRSGRRGNTAKNSSVVLPLGLIALDWVRLTNPWLRPVSRRPQQCRPGSRIPRTRPASDYTVRAVPSHPNVQVPAEMTLIRWQR